MSNPGQTLGRYELIARIGEGGMAEVYLARQRGPKAFEKLVVVKVVVNEMVVVVVVVVVELGAAADEGEDR